MQTKDNIIRIHSCFSGSGPMARAAHDLKLIKEGIEKLGGDVSEYCIDFKDCGLRNETIEGVAKEVFVSEIMIKPARFGGRPLQDVLDELAVMSRTPLGSVSCAAAGV